MLLLWRVFLMQPLWSPISITTVFGEILGLSVPLTFILFYWSSMKLWIMWWLAEQSSSFWVCSFCLPILLEWSHSTTVINQKSVLLPLFICFVICSLVYHLTVPKTLILALKLRYVLHVWFSIFIGWPCGSSFLRFLWECTKRDVARRCTFNDKTRKPILFRQLIWRISGKFGFHNRVVR